jgi:hypothetical protein
LLYHPNEPETLTISLKDPYNLKQDSLLKLLLCYSVKESVLYERMETSSMKPKQTGKIAKEYGLNRIYAPVLEVSYRPRWPRGSEFSTLELSSLLNSKTREETKRMLGLRQHGREESVGTKPLLDYGKEVADPESSS